jgi:membrane-bound ClpP family serine protease
LATPKAQPKRKVDRIGAVGVAVTDLRPSGRAEFDGHIIDAICSGRWIDSGTAVRIVRDGMEVKVEPNE